MKLGVNGWRIHGSSGVPRYIAGVVKHWSRQLVAERFNGINLYTPRPLDRTRVSLPEFIHERILKPDWRMLLWENLRLAPTCQDDVLWCPSYTRPLLTGAQVVVTTHDATPSLYPHLYPVGARVFYNRLYGISARRATLVLTHNNTTRKDIARCYKVPLDKIRVIPIAPAEIFQPLHDDPRISEIQKRYLDSDHPFFLNVGKMSTRRNVPQIIEGFARFKKLTKLPHKLVLVGQNTLNHPLGAIAGEAGIPNDLIHPEWVPDEDLVLLYNAAQALVLAQTYDSVSFPSLEAQATGTPLIISDSPGIRETTGDFALILPRVGVTEISEALTQIATDPELRTRLSEQGLKHVNSFSWERTSRETLAVLEEAGKMKGPSVSSPEPVAAS